jgi:hypothetical protein
MNKEDYSKYYIQGSEHYLIPKDIFEELYDEMNNWRNETKELKQKVNQIENKYNKALELLVDFNLPCERQMFMDRYSEWCELNCSVSDKCYKRCWNKYIEVELEKSKSE